MMDKNAKIAKELVKLAKELVATESMSLYDNPIGQSSSGIASQPGEYENYTGKIQFGNSNGDVQNATFKLMSDGNTIEWKKGTWLNGTWANEGFWSGGIWKNGTWHGGDFFNGVWENGKWMCTSRDCEFTNSTWKNGEWTGGTFSDNSTWENGVWNGGYGSLSGFHDKGDSPDKW